MKRLVIIGGGFAGSFLAKKLEKKFAVTLIDSKDYFEFTPSIIRTLVEPKHLKKIEILHTAYLKKAVVVRGMVTAVRSSEVLVGANSYPFDYLVIASGSRYNAPIKSSHFNEQSVVIAARGEELRNYAKQLETAKKVLIVGGGVVGTELAAEIAEKFPDKKIVLVHANEELLERNPSKARKDAEAFLRKRGVEIIFNERVQGTKKVLIKNKIKVNAGDGHQEEIFVTDKKREISAEMAFLCTGIIPNSEFVEMKSSGAERNQEKSCLDEKRFIRVNDFLQVEAKGLSNIFAVGDVNNIPEEKTAQSAEKQAEVVAYNLLVIAENEGLEKLKEQKELMKLEKLKKYVAKARPMVISLGKWRGIFVYSNFVWTGFLPGLLKMFIEWKTMRRYKK